MRNTHVCIEGFCDERGTRYFAGDFAWYAGWYCEQHHPINIYAKQNKVLEGGVVR